MYRIKKNQDSLVQFKVTQDIFKQDSHTLDTLVSFNSSENSAGLRCFYYKMFEAFKLTSDNSGQLNCCT